MDMARIEPDHKKRAAYYHEFQKILVEEVPVTWITEIRFPTVINAKFKDVIDSAIGICGNFRQGYIET